MNNKVVLIGLDGASYNIFMPWIKKGFLPLLKKLIENGVYGVLKSTIPPDTPPAWTSIFTGKNPGKHGVYGFLDSLPQFDEKGKKYVFRVVNSRCRRSPAIWNILSKEGKRVIVINVPLTYPPEPINGVMISGFLTPSLRSNFVYPRWLKPILVKKGYRIGAKFGKEEFSIKSLVENIRAKVKVARWLMKNFDWDLFIIVFMETDQVMHVHNDIRKALKIYQEVDNGISTLIKELPGKSHVILVSDHGFKKFKRAFFLNTFLWKKSLLKLEVSGFYLYARLLANLTYTLSDSALHIPLVRKVKD
ncbi:MAG: alkaline phosphatase family protein, partial [Candidatus Njordarchaeales archaeon]